MSKPSYCSIYCPFTQKSCSECSIYRGRHRYLILPKQYLDTTRRSKDPIADYFKALEKLSEPWADDASSRTKKDPQIRLKVIDVESGETKVCELSETKEWDWSNPEMMRVIDGWQVTSFDRLLEIVCNKAEKGYQEVKLYEAPRFMLLAGG